MLLFRTLRERRAARRKQREDGIKKVYDAISKSVDQHKKRLSGNNIFRPSSWSEQHCDPTGRRGGASDLDPRQMNTSMKPTEDEDDDDDDDDTTMTSSVYMPHSLSPTGNRRQTKTADHDVSPTGSTAAEQELLARKEDELRVSMDRLDELRDRHESALADKDDELLDCQVGYGFAKEEIERLRADLDEAKVRLREHRCELGLVKADLNAMELKIHETMQELDETKESLAGTRSRLDEAELTIEQQAKEIYELGKAIEQGERGAKMVLGLLTLGALCATE